MGAQRLLVSLSGFIVLFIFLGGFVVSAQDATPPTVCPAGKYGVSCENACSQNCKTSSKTCDKNSGACVSGCLAGWNPNHAKCDIPCDNGYWGEGCSSKCSQHCTATCNKVNGACSCNPGYQSPLCVQPCGPGEWGANCNQRCSQQCLNSSACNPVTGACPCVVGYAPPNCSAKCSSERYGQDCAEKCGECVNGYTDCNHVTGACLQCKDNRALPLCKDCVAGKYGSTCSQDCGHCGAEGHCDRLTGNCQSEICLPGWRNLKCDEKCPEGFYGQDCLKECGRCQSGTPCRYDNGLCEHDCEEGFEGVLCQRSRTNVVGPVVGAVLTAGILIAIAIIASVWYLKRRSNLKRNSQSKEGITTMAEVDAVESNDLARGEQPSEAYQNVSFQSPLPLEQADSDLNPAASYDHMDLSKRAQEAHYYLSHKALLPALRESTAKQHHQTGQPEQDPVYQNTTTVMAMSSGTSVSAEPAETATYGNFNPGSKRSSVRGK